MGPYQQILNDKEYLLRCALTYNWDILVDFCELLMEVLSSSNGYYSNHSHRPWRGRNSKYVDATVEQLTRQDEWGNTALHAACYNNPPLRVVTTLLQCASAANLPYWHLTQSRDMSTPLNIACATGASTDIIRVLLSPPAGLEPGGAAVTMADARGCTPLSELVIHYELQRKSPYYAKTAPSLDRVDLVRGGINTTNIYGSNCDDGVCSGSNDKYINGSSYLGKPDHDPFFESFWIKVDLIIRAAWSYSSSSSSFITLSPKQHDDGNVSEHEIHYQPYENEHQQHQHLRPWISVLHGAANISQYCPTVLASLICRSYPAMIGFADRKGLLPLHLAVLDNSSSSSSNNIQHNIYQLQLAKQQSRWIEQLTDYFPGAVRQPLPNGRSVFCQAIVSGLYWNLNIPTMSNYNSNNRRRYRRRNPECQGKHSTIDTSSSLSSPSPSEPNAILTAKGPLSYLWKHDPEVLTTPDKFTGLFPFMLAATIAAPTDSSSSSSSYSQYGVDNPNSIMQLDTIYSLLRLHPQVLQQDSM